MLAANDNQNDLLRTVRNLSITVSVCLLIAGGVFTLGFKCMSQEMSQRHKQVVASAEERQQVLFRSCLNGNYMVPTRSPACAQLSDKIVKLMNSEKGFQ